MSRKLIILCHSWRFPCSVEEFSEPPDGRWYINEKIFLGAANQLNIQIAGKIGIEIAEETTARALLEEIVLKKRIWQSDDWAIWRSGDMAIMVNRRLANWPIGRSDYSAIWWTGDQFMWRSRDLVYWRFVDLVSNKEMLQFLAILNHNEEEGKIKGEARKRRKEKMGKKIRPIFIGSWR